MARIPEPNNIRALKGEQHKERYLPDAIKVAPLTEIPKPPAWWSPEAAELYQNKGKLLLAHNMLTELDLNYIQQLCLIENKLNEIWKSGEIPPGVLITQYNSYCAHLGLSTISRQKFNQSHAVSRSNKYYKQRPRA